MTVRSNRPDLLFAWSDGQLVAQITMNEFDVEILGLEIEDSIIIQAIHAKEIVSHSDRTVAKCLIKFLARRVSYQRNLSAIA